MYPFHRPRAVPDPLGCYLRTGPADESFLIKFLGERNSAHIRGIVIDAALDRLQSTLLAEAESQRLETVADLAGMELATAGGFAAHCNLPWAGSSVHTPEQLSGPSGAAMIREIVRWVQQRNYTAVIAPAHFLDRGVQDPWFAVDIELTRLLREALDNAGMEQTLIYYPLAVRPECFFHIASRDVLRQTITSLPIDGLWIRVHRFGSNSSGHDIRRYVRTCAEFHGAGIPLVADRVGMAGLPLLACNAVGAVSTGITTGDQLDFTRLKHTRKTSGFAGPRIYVTELQAFIPPDRAKKFFDKRGAKPYFACKDDNCCLRGYADMIANPRRHYLVTRLAEIRRINDTRRGNRLDVYFEAFLRPANSWIVTAAKGEPALRRAHRRVESWWNGLREIAPPATYSPVPTGRRLLLRRGA